MNNDDWKADTAGSIFFFILLLGMMIEWDIVAGWFK